jgi:hypothetical protein
MKKRSTHAENVNTRHIIRVVSFITSNRYMKERSTHAGNRIIRQLLRVVPNETSKKYMKGRSIHAGNANAKSHLTPAKSTSRENISM